MSNSWERNEMLLRIQEEKYLMPPVPQDPPSCQSCGEFPGDDFLYLHNDLWVCEECLKSSFPRRDIYMEDWGDMDA